MAIFYWQWTYSTTSWNDPSGNYWSTDYGNATAPLAWRSSPQTHTTPQPSTPKARDRANLEAIRAREVKRRRSFRAPVVL